MNKVTFNQVEILSEFWNERIETVRKKTIWQVLNKCNGSRVQNFVAAKAFLDGDKNQTYHGRFYDDSDVYKALEGVGYLLTGQIDNDLMAFADEIIDKIHAAQWPDGYISTYFTLSDEERYSDMDRHELYCGGHLIEAGISYYRATGKDKLLNIGIRLADHWIEHFKDKNWVCGHPEAELSLYKLYELTGQTKYRDLSFDLLGQRGKNHYKSVSRPITDESIFYALTYAQDHLPVIEQRQVTGHAVRAMYLYTAMAMHDLPVKDLYDDLLKRMYITGGIGDSVKNEGFSEDNNMKNENAYAETCASIGGVFFADNLKQNLGQHHLIEKLIYNNILSGLSVDGDKFFYINPMVSNGLDKASGGHKERSTWFKTSCCPTNLARFIPSIASYIYRYSDDAIYINQHIASKVKIDQTELTLLSNYPRDGHFKVSYTGNSRFKKLFFRLPSWLKRFEIDKKYQVLDDYICIDLEEAGQFSIDFNLEVRKISTPSIPSNDGKMALGYGPFVYCFEGVDGDLENIKLKENYQVIWHEGLKVNTLVNDHTAIPYYMWGNRGKSSLKVFVKDK